MNTKRFLGIIIILLGVLLLFNGAGITDIGIGDLISNYWPLLLVGGGLFNLISNPVGKLGGLIVFLIGLSLQLRVLGYFNIFDFEFFWPIVLILVGFWLIFKRGDNINHLSEDSFNIIAIFSGFETKSVSKKFKGGSIIAIFGGAEVDLRKADIAEDQVARIDVLAMFGGVDIYVPEGWNVVVSGLPIFGGWENSTKKGDPNGPTLKVSGLAIFGGFDISD
ncbi:LiaF transmembrane domain-containing protein [Halonatronum saccharophilum]|uniref:LiaF transmembrane domain-containing protein n=1 Tax=Halonatronum saccharophilum TaxID=150060 RepID=UPI000489D105|nr:LiaF domain-containing protein [Halonatronum saccharophilum]